MQFVGIEIGIHATHAVVVDLDSARTIAEASVSHSWIEGLPSGYREQDPAKWINAVDETVRNCLAQEGVDRKQIAALGIAGPQRGTVILDDQHRIIRPTKVSGDISVQKQTDEIARAFGGAPGLLELIGQVPPLGSTASECLWLKQHEPYHYQRIDAVLSVQDFIAYWLTGERATEPGSASTTGFLDIRTKTWSEEMIHFVDPELEAKLPTIGASDQARGLLRAALAKQWGLSDLVQVGAGSSAPLLSSLAAGCVKEGSVLIELGITSSIIGVDSKPVIDLRDEILPLCSATDSWAGIACSLNTSIATEAIKRHYGWSTANYEQMVGSVSPGADGLLLLPYFSAETIPKLNEGCGVLHGMNPTNFTPAHLARATAEGVIFGLSYAMSRLREMGFQPDEIKFIGNTTHNSVTSQMLADALGTPLKPIHSEKGAAIGAAMQAAVAFFHNCGESLGYEELCSYLVQENPEKIWEPNEENHQLYLDLMARQQYLVDTLHPAGFL